MIYTVSSGTLNSTIPLYYTIPTTHTIHNSQPSLISPLITVAPIAISLHHDLSSATVQCVTT